MIHDHLKSRIIEYPFFVPGFMRIEGSYNFSFLTDSEKMLVYIIAHSEKDQGVRKIQLMKYFVWTAYKVAKLAKELKPHIQVEPTFDDDGMISGKAYFYNQFELL